MSRLRGQLCSTASLAESAKYKKTISYIPSCIVLLKANVNVGRVSVFCDTVEVCKVACEGLG